MDANMYAQGMQEENANMQRRIEELQAQLEASEAARLVGQRNVDGVDQGLQARNRSSMGWNLKPAKPSMYDGKRDIPTLTNFHFRLDEAFAYGNVLESMKSKVAATFMVGDAFVWYRAIALKYQHEPYVPWEVLKEEMFKSFAPPNAEALWLDKWDSIRQLTSVASFVAQFQIILMHIGEMPEELVLAHFIRRLKPKLKLEVTLRKPTTLTEAIQIADRYDVLTHANGSEYKGKGVWTPRQTSGTSTYSTPSTRSSSNYYGTPMELDNLIGRKPKPTTGNRGTNSKPFTGKCFNCDKIGHRANECRQPKRSWKAKLSLTELESESKNTPSQ
jgi:hypothetical protein